MMRYPRLIALLISFFTTGFLHAAPEKVYYTEPDKNELRDMEFEIIGKYNGNFLIYKNVRQSNYISVYDEEMKLKENIPLENMPDRIIAADVIAYPEFSYLFYQYQRRSIVYCMMLKVGPDGKSLTQPIELDTTELGMGGSRNRVYSVLPSENKDRIMVFKINSRNERRYAFKTLLFDNEMTLLHSSRLFLGMTDRNDFLTDFYLDNDGNLVFGHGLRPGMSDNINRFFLIVKPVDEEDFRVSELKLSGITLDQVKLRMDNYNNRYLFTGFYYKGRRTINIEGISNAIYDKKAKDWVVKNVIPLGEELRQDAKGDNNVRSAFDDYYLKDIIIRRDGGFIAVAESMYQTSRGNIGGYNRWGNMYNYDYYNYQYGSMYPYSYYNNARSNMVRYHADNIVVAAFDKDGKLVLSNTIRKSQFDDQSDAAVSYQMMNSGDALNFLYNDYDKRDILLTYQAIDATGKVSRPPTLRNLDKGYDFLPRFGKQVSAHTVIIPCLFRNFLCFARVDI